MRKLRRQRGNQEVPPSRLQPAKSTKIPLLSQLVAEIRHADPDCFKSTAIKQARRHSLETYGVIWDDLEGPIVVRQSTASLNYPRDRFGKPKQED